MENIILNYKEQVKKMENNYIQSFYSTLIKENSPFPLLALNEYKYEEYYTCFHILEDGNTGFATLHNKELNNLLTEIKQQNIQHVNDLKNKALNSCSDKDIALLVQTIHDHTEKRDAEKLIKINNVEAIKEVIILNHTKYVFSIEPYLLHTNGYIYYQDLTLLAFDTGIANLHEQYTIIYKCSFSKLCKSTEAVIDIKPPPPPLPPLLSDAELIELFGDTIKTTTKKKHIKNKPVIAFNDIIDTVNSIEEVSVDNTDASIHSDTSDITTDDTASFDDTPTETNIKYPFKTSYNNKVRYNAEEIEQIDKLLYDLYDSNDKFKNIISDYHTICILKGIHRDRNGYAKSDHITAFFRNDTDQTAIYHFYILHNKIHSITQIINIL
jgi:hypothetical protein